MNLESHLKVIRYLEEKHKDDDLPQYTFDKLKEKAHKLCKDKKPNGSRLQ